MGAADIDRLEIEVEAQAKGANQQLDALISKLEKVSSVLGGASGKGLNSFASGISKISGHTAAIEKMASSMEKLKDGLSFDSQKLTNIASGIRTLSDSATGFKGGKSAEITSLARALSKFSEVDTNSMYGVTSALQNLSNGLAEAQNINVAGVTSIAAALSKLGGKNATTGTGNLIKIKDDLASFVVGMNNIGAMTFDVTGLAQLIPTLSKLGGKSSTQATKNLPTLSAQLQSFVRQMNQIGELKFNMSGMNEMASAISRLGGVAAGRAITNLPLLAKNLSELMETLSKAPAVSNNIIEMTNALAKLASQGSKVGSTLSTMGNKGSKSTSILSGLFSSDGKAGKSLKSFSQIAGAFYANFFMVIRGFKGLWNTVNSSMDFLETVNYFEVAMRKLGDDAAANWQQAGYDSAEAYASSFSSRAKQLTAKMTGFDIDTDGNATYTGQKNLGMNPDTVMNYQAMFAQVSESIGVAEESALNFSTALTMLGTDWASLRNTTFEQAFEKFASALAGQSRAVRAFGIDITNATLQEYAYKYGLTGAISEMNQATKAQLRLLAILDQSKVAYGDLANTMESPANQLRMLKQNFSNLARTIGNLFLPIIEKVLPYINGLVMAMQRLFAWVGGLLGINLSGINSSIGGASNGIEDLVGGADDAEDALNGANDAAKKLKNTVLGFDELNQLNDPTSGSNSGSGSGVGGGNPLLDAEISKALEEYQKAWDDAFDRMENKAQKIADKIYYAFSHGNFEGIGRFIGSSIRDGLNKINWDSVYSASKNFGTNFAKFLNGLISPSLFGTVGRSIAGALNSAIYSALAFGNTFDFKDLGKSIGTGLNEFFRTYDFTSLGRTINVWANGILDAIIAAIDTTNWEMIGRQIGKFLENLNLLEIGVKVGKALWKAINAGIKTFATTFSAAPIETTIVSMVSLNKLTKNMFGTNVFSGIANAAKKFNSFSKAVDLAGSALKGNCSSMMKLESEYPKTASLLTKVSAGFSRLKTSATGGNFWGSLKTSIAGVRSNLTTLQKGAIGVAAVFGEITVFKESFRDIALQTDNMAESIGKVTVAAGLAAGALYLAFDTPGIIIAAIAGLVGAITGVKEAMDEIVDEKVGDAIYDAFSNPGGVPIDTVVSNFTDSIEEAGKGFSTLSEKSNEMDNVQKNIQDTWIEITRIETAMDNGVLSVEEGKEKLAELFGELATLTEQKFATMEQTVIAAYGEGGALHDALENIGADTDAAIDAMITYGFTNTERAKEIVQEMNQVEVGSDKWKELSSELYSLSSDLDGFSKAASDYSVDINNIVKGIDYDKLFPDGKEVDMDVLNGYLDDMKTAVDNYDSNLEEAQKDISAYWTELLNSPNATPEQKEVAQKALDDLPNAIQNMKDKAHSEMTQVTDLFQTDFVDRINDVITKAQKEWDDMNPWDKFWSKLTGGPGTEDEFVREAVEKQIGNIDELSDAIEARMDELGVDGAGWGKDVTKDLLDSLFDTDIYITDYGSGEACEYTLKKNYEDIINNALESAKPSITDTAKDVASATVDEFNNGVEESKGASLETLDNWMGDAGNVLTDSSVTDDASNSARNTVETFNAGISNNTGTTVDTLTSFRTTITDNIAPASSDIENIGKNIVDGISNGMNLRLKSLGETTSKIANTIVETTRSKLDIHSPSKVMKALGNYTTEGYLIGLNNKVGDVKSALSNMVEPVTMEPVSARKFVAREKVAMASITAPRNTVSTDAIMQGFMEEMKPAITEAVFEAMMANSNSSIGEKNAPTVEVTLKTDNETLYKMVKKGKESYNRRYHIVEDMG